jgi:chemotaxis protein MotB
MDDKKKIIIVKRIKKVAGGHHGGSWKVAYADFVTAMMAFFLLMWLLSMVSPEKRAVMALYFKNFSLFQEGGQSFMSTGGFNPMSQKGGEEYNETGQAKHTGVTDEELKGQIMSDLQQTLQGSGASASNLMVETSDMGVRIQVFDTQDNVIFPPGSYQMTEAGKKILRSVAGTMKRLPNKIVLEGHTDASQTKNEQLSNWELSSLRACAARKELELDGLDGTRIARVVGFANREPLFRENLDDPRNRRVSIIFLYNKKKQKPSDPYEWVWKTPPAS